MQGGLLIRRVRRLKEVHAQDNIHTNLAMAHPYEYPLALAPEHAQGIVALYPESGEIPGQVLEGTNGTGLADTLVHNSELVAWNEHAKCRERGAHTTLPEVLW